MDSGQYLKLQWAEAHNFRLLVRQVTCSANSTDLNHMHVISAGVPDPPIIEGMEDILEWEKPSTRGSEILKYKVLAM